MSSEGTPLEDVMGIGPTTAKKLREFGIPNAEFLARASYTEYWRSGIGEGTIKKVINNARTLLNMGPKDGLVNEQESIEQPSLTSGLIQLDKHLMGGFHQGTLIEVYGPARGGKTILSSQLAVRAQLPEDGGGLESKVLWLDTQSSFNHLTIRTIAERFGLDQETTLANIIIHRIVNLDHLMDTLKQLPDLCVKEGIRFIVIDSLGALFGIEYSNLESKDFLHRRLNEALSILRTCVKAVNGVCILTNVVYSKISCYGGNPNSPMNGHTLAHGVDYRLYIRRIKRETRRLDLQKSPGLPEYDTELHIGWGGLFSSRMDLKIMRHKGLEIVSRFYPDDPEISDGLDDDTRPYTL